MQEVEHIGIIGGIMLNDCEACLAKKDSAIADFSLVGNLIVPLSLVLDKFNIVLCPG